MEERRCGAFGTPLGRMCLTADSRGIRSLKFADPPADLPRDDGDLLRETERQIHAYFSGRRTSFDLPIHLEGTDFQRAVWRKLLRIPYGETRSYQEIACAIGRPGAARAVGAACAANPIWILIPCHRVIASDGRLTGYAGGIDRKQRLLALERRLIRP